MHLHRTAAQAAAALACLLLADFDGKPAPACPTMFLARSAPEASRAIARGATLLCKADYATFVSPATRDPVWVAEHLTTEQIMSAGMIRRHCVFRSDRELDPDARAELRDYRKSGWDRGHMAPDADMPNDERAAGELRLGERRSAGSGV